MSDSMPEVKAALTKDVSKEALYGRFLLHVMTERGRSLSPSEARELDSLYASTLQTLSRALRVLESLPPRTEG